MAQLIELPVRPGKELFQRVGAAAFDQYPAHTYVDAHRDLKKPEPDLPDGGPLQFGPFQHAGPQLVPQQMGGRTEPEPQLVARHPVGAGPVGEQVHLLFFDPVFHLAALTGKLVTMKRGFSPFSRTSSLATTRRLRDQLSRVV